MARKTSDIAMLLSSRSKSRSRSGGFGSSLIGFIDGLLGRSSRSGRRSRDKRPQAVSVWVFVIGLLVAFGGGFLIGGSFGGGGKAGPDPLRAPGREPALLNQIDTQPLTSAAFIVSSYQGVPDNEAKTRAFDLSKYLQDNGLASARPYPWPQEEGVLWLVAVYYDGSADAAIKARMLQALPTDVPDKMFCHWRKTESEWPMPWSIQ